MSEALALLSAALDPEGWICIWAKNKAKGSQAIQKFFAPGQYQEAINEIMRLDGQGLDAYWCTSTLLSNANRQAINVHRCRLFKIDLDIGKEEHKYKSRSEAYAALLVVCAAIGMPVPTVVMSGYGLHCYWLLNASMEHLQAERFSKMFKAVLAFHGLKTDTSVTADMVRILRLPGSHNHKRDVPKAVQLLSERIDIFGADDICDIISREFDLHPAPTEVDSAANPFGHIPAHVQTSGMNDSTKFLLGGKPKKFEVIRKKSAAGVGCNQLHTICTKQAEQHEPRWRAGLSIAINCIDGLQEIHAMSSAHPGYVPQDTIDKAAGVNGKPYHCATFYADAPHLCEGCKHFDEKTNKFKLTSPIQLGEYVELAAASDNIVVSKIADGQEVDNQLRTFTIPDYPYPYKRAKAGGVIIESDDGEVTTICDYDLYIVRRLKSSEEGVMMQLQAHFPKDGVVAFVMPTEDLGSDEKIRSRLNREGVVTVDGAPTKSVRNYIMRWYKTMEKETAVDWVREQFGWAEDMKSFVIGASEVKPDAIDWCPTAKSLQNHLKMFKPTGSYDTWKHIFNHYTMPGMEAHAFGALVGFGAPLMEFTPLDAATINLTSPSSGAGKSTVQEAQCSIWAEPRKMMIRFKDSDLSKYHRMGAYKSMPVCIDEMTDAPVEQLSSLMYEITQGMGKNRMSSSANVERDNNTSWKTLVTMSSNSNFSEKLQAAMDGVEGQLMRLVEVDVPELTSLMDAETGLVFTGFQQHYGHAGREYIQYILQNVDSVRERFEYERSRFIKDAKANNKERFWTTAYTVVYLGGCIAHELGIHNIDMARMRKWMLGHIEVLRGTLAHTRNSVKGVSDTLGSFLNANIGGIIKAYEDKRNKGNWTIPDGQPVRNVVARVEPDNGLVFVAMREFNEFCVARKIAIKQYLDAQAVAGVYMPDAPQTRRLLAGTHMKNAPPVRVYTFRLVGD